MSEDESSADWPRPVVHWEIVVRDAERQANFYGQLFNWRIGEGDIKPVAAGLGGPEPGPDGHLRSGGNPGVSLYVQVRDLHQSISLAQSLGGKLLRAPFNAPGPITVCSILDPEGNRIVLVQQ